MDKSTYNHWKINKYYCIKQKSYEFYLYKSEEISDFILSAKTKDEAINQMKIHTKTNNIIKRTFDGVDFYWFY